MAIWQFKVYCLPQEEIDSFFEGENQIRESDFDHIKWWKYRKISEAILSSKFKYFEEGPSWNSSLYLLGQNDSDNCKVLSENDYFEMSFQFDLRELNRKFILDVIEFSSEQDLIFLNNQYKIFIPTLNNLMDQMNNSHEKSVLIKLNELSDDDFEFRISDE